MTQNFKISGIISEFNPYHLGHQSLIVQTRQAGATHIVAIMSGNFVQRGEPACFDKWVRTKTALSAGVDLVIELPLPWVVAGAETFAAGGVSIVNALGCVHQLSFGSECGDIEALSAVADILRTEQFSQALQVELQKGVTFASARQAALLSLTNQKTASLLEHPNNILAIAYCNALKDINSTIRPFTIKRIGASHHDISLPPKKIASASQIRRMMEQNQEYATYIPKETYPYLASAIQNTTAPASIQRLERAILAKLRTMTLQEFANLPDVSEGLEHRLYKAAKTAVSLTDFYAYVKTKRYTHARIRRITLCAFLNIQAAYTQTPPPYLHVLGFNQKGKELLSLIKQTASLPIITQYNQLRKLSPYAKTLFELETTATDLYGLSTPQVQPCGKEFTQGIVTALCNER